MAQEWSTPSPSGAAGEIPNYLIPAIVATILCCPPLGIVSIIFAAQVNSKIASGDIAGAMESSRKAKLFMFIAIGVGLLVYILLIILFFVFGMAALSSQL